VSIHDPVLEGTGVFDEPDVSLRELERLLKEGLGMTLDEMAVLKFNTVELATLGLKTLN
jgi:hypothetical protein